MSAAGKTLVAAVLALAAAAGFAAPQVNGTNVTKSVVILEAHPGEIVGCLGATLVLKQKGFAIHVIDVTYGEDGAQPGVCAEEERKACAALGATLHFLGRTKGDVFADIGFCMEIAKLFEEIKPAAVLTHWPIDVDADRMVTGGTAYKALSLANRYTLEPLTQLYFFETLCGTLNFHPQYYVYTNHVRMEGEKVLRCYDRSKLKAENPSAFFAATNVEKKLTVTGLDPTTLRAWECFPIPRHAEAYVGHDNYVYASTTGQYYPLPIFAEISSAFGKEHK